MSKSSKKGVTLVEIVVVAIIFAVIGFIITSVLGHVYKEKLLVNNLQKAYMKITQNLKQLAVDSNCEENLKCTKLFSKTNSNEIFGNEFVKYFDVEKNCKTDVKQGCWASVKESHTQQGVNIDFDNEPIGKLDLEKYKFTTKDGMSIAVNANTKNCSANFSSGKDGYLKNVCGYLYIDVNGPKKPNALGRDVFAYYIVNSNGPGLYPFGGEDDARLGYWKEIGGCQKNDPKSGEYCTGRIMDDDWIVNY